MKYAFILQRPVLILFPAFLVVAIWFTKDPGSPDNIPAGVTEARVADTLPQLTRTLQVEQLQGVRHVKESGSIVYYFEYETDQKQLMHELNRLNFSLDSARVDIQLREVAIETQQHIKKLLLESTVRKYFTVANDDYLTLECIKGSEHHYLLLSNSSPRVIHLVERT